MSPGGGNVAIALAVTACALLSVTAASAASALKLTIPRATERAAAFAGKTCEHDERCVASGVLNCNRKGNLVVHCRIFDERHTKAQGRYRCNREIRMVMNRKTRRVPVNGLGRWHCGGGSSPSAASSTPHLHPGSGPSRLEHRLG